MKNYKAATAPFTPALIVPLLFTTAPRHCISPLRRTRSPLAFTKFTRHGVPTLLPRSNLFSLYIYLYLSIEESRVITASSSPIGFPNAFPPSLREHPVHGIMEKSNINLRFNPSSHGLNSIILLIVRFFCPFRLDIARTPILPTTRRTERVFIERLACEFAPRNSRTSRNYFHAEGNKGSGYRSFATAEKSLPFLHYTGKVRSRRRYRQS